jgi:hypothetical protein
MVRHRICACALDTIKDPIKASIVVASLECFPRNR